MRAALAALLLCAAAAHAAAPLHADEFALSSQARSSDWFGGFRATFDDAAAQRFANPGASAAVHACRLNSMRIAKQLASSQAPGASAA
jgi:hypothetical protein